MNQLDAEFFYTHGCKSYNPESTVHRLDQYWEHAEILADALVRAHRSDIRFAWGRDGRTNREWTDEGSEYETWYCRAFDMDGCDLASLCGIDFGEYGHPDTEAYARVIEAELAQEIYSC